MDVEASTSCAQMLLYNLDYVDTDKDKVDKNGCTAT